MPQLPPTFPSFGAFLKRKHVLHAVEHDECPGPHLQVISRETQFFELGSYIPVSRFVDPSYDFRGQGLSTCPGTYRHVEPVHIEVLDCFDQEHQALCRSVRCNRHGFAYRLCKPHFPEFGQPLHKISTILEMPVEASAADTQLMAELFNRQHLRALDREGLERAFEPGFKV